MEFVNNEVSCYPSTDAFVVTEMTEHWFWHFYECMPPYWDKRFPRSVSSSFMVSEPHSHIDRAGLWTACYRMCIKNSGRYFSVVMPIDFNSDEMAKVMDEIHAA